MKHLPPKVKQQIIEAWSTGTVSEHQIAEEFNVSRAFVSEVVGEHKAKHPLRKIQRGTLAMARDLYSVMPTEIAGSFARRFEDITGGHAGLLMTPGM